MLEHRTLRGSSRRGDRDPSARRGVFRAVAGDRSPREAGKETRRRNPRNLSKTFFSTSGTEAIEAAIKIARLYTGKHEIVSRYRSYHGATYGSISVTGDPRRLMAEPGLPGTIKAPDPYAYGSTLDPMESLEYVDEMLMLEGDTVAAVLVEPVVGSNGILVPPPEYLPRLKEIAHDHGALHCLRLEEGHSYRETPNRLRYMTEIRDVLGLDRDDLPDYSTIYKSFDRLKMWAWRVLLRVSAQQRPQSGHTALDSTFFDRRRASSYFRQRSGSTVQMLKVTTLTDVESLAVLDVHITARGKHDTKTGPQVVRRNADDLLTVAADNGFRDWHTEYEIAAHDVEYLVHYRGSSPKAAMNNALIRTKGYSQRWMADIDSSVKLS